MTNQPPSSEISTRITVSPGKLGRRLGRRSCQNIWPRMKGTVQSAEKNMTWNEFIPWPSALIDTSEQA